MIKDMMKKVDMIKTIQLAEARAWLALKESQVKNGKLNSTTRDLKERWMTLKCLMGSLDIESDVELEESKIALGMMLDNFRISVF
jgi:hypothetical protein